LGAVAEPAHREEKDQAPAFKAQRVLAEHESERDHPDCREKKAKRKRLLGAEALGVAQLCEYRQGTKACR